jgi:nucleoside-diphosphate-sugar epimerase
LRVLVTGCAGFIGSWVSEALLRGGHEVLGVDCFVDFYPRHYKEANLRQLKEWTPFRFVEADISKVRAELLREWLSEYPFVSHQAAQAGVRSSWGRQFEGYTQHNILATQRLLEAAREVSIRRFVFASSSSVYGQTDVFPLREDGPTLPVSPYGVTKLAAEHLTRLYYLNYGVPTVALRYFTVYGPRQRPDMAFHRLVRGLLLDEPFPLYGDGSQSRSFTYITDVVQANLAALFTGAKENSSPFLGEPINVGGGARTTLNEAISLAEDLTGKRVRLQRSGTQRGDVDRTEADLSRAERWLGYEPRATLPVGLRTEVEWLQRLIQAEKVAPRKL